MYFALTEDLLALQECARTFLVKSHPLDANATIADQQPGWEPALWTQLADLGLIDRELDLLEHMVIVEETAAVLLPAPVFSSFALARQALIEAAKDSGALGDLDRCTLAWIEPGGPQNIGAGRQLSTTVDAAGMVHGRKVLVPEAPWVDSAVVLADGSNGPTLVSVKLSDTAIREAATEDTSRRVADIEFDGAPSIPLVASESVPRVLCDTRRRALTLSAAEALGVGRSALEFAITHARERTQFGKPIGAYQAISHRLADAYTQLELARSLTYWAAAAVSGDDADADAACAAAKSTATAAAVGVCEAAIQVFGAVGMTWEHPIHRLYKRALWLEAFAANHRQLHADIAENIL